jgi:hypothetical protein
VISGVDFMMYCAGVGTLMVSSAAAFRLIAGDRRNADAIRHKTEQAMTKNTPKWEPIPDPASEGLQDRLQAFQAARFSSPIVQRTLTDDVGPVVRPVIIPPPISHEQRWAPRVPTRLRPTRTTPSNDTKLNKVVQFPMKQKKDPEGDK